MAQASSGTFTSLPAATITPLAMTTVALSMGGPETGTIFAPRMANVPGSPPCADAIGTTEQHAAASTPAQTATRPHLRKSGIRTPREFDFGRILPPSNDEVDG